MKGKRILCISLMLCSAIIAAMPASAAVVKLAQQSAAANGQVAVLGLPTLLKGGLVDNDTNVLSFRWTINTSPATTLLQRNIVPGENLRNLSAPYTFTQNLGNKKITLAVFNITDPGPDATPIASATTNIKFVVDDAEGIARRELIVDEAMWYLHTQLIPEGDSVTWLDRNYNEGLVIIASAFVKEGYSLGAFSPATVPLSKDPYVEDFWRLVNHILNNLYGVTEGVYYCGNQENTYGFGPALEVLVKCGYDPLTTTTSQGLLGEVIQRMVNWLAWLQLGTNGFDWNECSIVAANPPKAPCPSKDEPGSPSTMGGWPYLMEGWGCTQQPDGSFVFDWNKVTYGDSSISWWAVTGLKAAEAAGYIIPDVKTNLRTFLDGVNPCLLKTQDPPTTDNFGPTTAWHLIERAGQGMTLNAFVSRDVSECAGTVNALFPFHNYQHGQSHPWAEAGPLECASWNMDGAENCYSHYKLDAVEYGHWEPDGVWVVDGTTNDINIFAFKNVAEGARLDDQATTQVRADACSIYISLLWENQQFFGNGSIDDSAWSSGYLFGTAWGIDTMAACRP